MSGKSSVHCFSRVVACAENSWKAFHLILNFRTVEVDKLSGYIHHSYGIIYFKYVAILHPQKQRYGVVYVKRGGGDVGVKHVIHHLAPYFIYVCGNLQYILLVIENFYYCVYGNVNYMSLFHYINGHVGHQVDRIQLQKY